MLVVMVEHAYQHAFVMSLLHPHALHLANHNVVLIIVLTTVLVRVKKVIVTIMPSVLEV
jgi:hypothetical protein